MSPPPSRVAAGAVTAILAVASAVLWAQAASAAAMLAGGLPLAVAARLSVGFAMLSIPYALAVLAVLCTAAALGVRGGPASALCVSGAAGASYALRVAPHEGRMGWVDASALVLCIGIPLGVAAAATCLAWMRAGAWADARQRRGAGMPAAASASAR